MALDPLTAALDIGGKLIDRMFPDPAQKAQASMELLKMQQTGELAYLNADVQLATGQQDINKIEAASPSLFVSGWRPFVGWVCGTAFAFKFIAGPLAVVVMAVVGHPIVLPVFDFTEISTLLLALLGLGGMRSYEKKNGVA